MYCDNREFMFGRDFVSCVMRKLSPRWLEPQDFRYGARNGSPFTSSFQQIVESLIESNHYAWENCFKEMPLTFSSFSWYLKRFSEKHFQHHQLSPHRHLEFYLAASTLAAHFFNNGSPADYHIFAADLITKFIFRLRKEGVFDETMWPNYEIIIGQLPPPNERYQLMS